MNRSEIQSRIRILRQELENRYKYGTIKLAAKDGSAISSESIQNELYFLIYKSSKLD